MTNLKQKYLAFFLLLFSFLNFLYSSTEVFFSPDDHPKSRLIRLIESAKTKIYAAVYMFTDKDIASALVKAKQSGVDVKIIVDPTTTESKFGQVQTLKKNGITVFVFDTKQHHSSNLKAKSFAALMHNKFAVVDDTTVWTGSFNWTQSANVRNQENVVITTNKNAYKRFLDHFSILTKRCYQLSNNKYNNDNNEPQKQTFEISRTGFRKWLTDLIKF